MPKSRQLHPTPQPRRRSPLQRWLRRLLLFSTVLIILFSFSIGGVEAADGMRGNNCVVAKEDVIEHDFYFTCIELTIEGTIDGDLIGIASNVRIEQGAVVTGDIWLAAGKLEINGDIGDDIHFGGGKLHLRNDITFSAPRVDLAAIAVSVEVNDEVTLPGDILVLCYQAVLDGDIGGTVDFQGQTLHISGVVAGNVAATVGDNREESPLRTFGFLPYDIDLLSPGFIVGPEAVIEGNLDYEAPQRVNLPRNSIRGEQKYTQSLQQADITRVEQSDTFLSVMRTYLVSVLQNMVSLMLVGVFIQQFMPILMIEPGKRVQRTFVSAFAWGSMLFILSVPVAVFLIFFSILMIVIVTFISLSSLTLAAILFFMVVDVVIIGGFWFFLVYVSRTITCFIIGVFLLRRVLRYWHGYRHARNPDDPPLYIPVTVGRYRWVALALGVVTFSLIANLPIPSSLNTLKLLFQGPIAFIGLGAIFMYIRDLWHMARGDWFIPEMTSSRWEAVPSDQDLPLGLDNLPDSFRGFFD